MQAELTVTEAVKHSGFTRQHLYDLITRNRIKHRRLQFGGVLILIDRESLDEYMKSKHRRRKGGDDQSDAAEN